MTINLTAPKSWKELTEKQLTYVSWLMTNKQLSSAEFQTYAFVRFSGIKIIREIEGIFYCRFKKQYFTLTTEELASFCKQMSWLTFGITEIVPLPELSHKKHIDVRLRNCPFAQYLACENYYQAYIFTKQEKFLNYLIAAFYISGKPFNDNETAKRAKQFEKQPFHLRHTVFLWYYGLKSVLQTNFPHFFQKVEQILEDEEQQAPNMREQINIIIRALTGGDITKSNAIYNADTWTALAELDAKALEYKELEARMKKYK